MTAVLEFTQPKTCRDKKPNNGSARSNPIIFQRSESPKISLGHVTSNYDADQVFFYELMGGEPGAWPGLMRSSMKQVRSEVDNFRYYVGPGPLHCITPYDFMFDKTGDSPFIDWLNAFVYDETLPADVACEGAACDSAPLCDECAAQEAAGVAPDAYCGFCADWPEKFVASGD